MKITFLGAAKTVTGSNFLVEAAGKKFLVDCGMYQGKVTEEFENSDPFLYDVNSIDFMLLTHAHIDHSGRIPKLYNEGFRGNIYATKATCDLCGIMLPDSGHIQEVEVVWKNKKRIRQGEKALPPLYTAEDAYKCLEIFKPVDYDDIVEIDDNISVRFNDAGHMLGSSIIEVWVTEDGKTKKIVFTGDLGNNDLPLLDSPTMISNADYLVMESTYGNRLHIRNDDKAKMFLDIVSETLDNGGRVIIPSFAVGRTQEILYEIDKLKEEFGQDEEFARKYETLMKVPVYVDSPLAISATEVFKKNVDLFEDEIQEKIKRGDNPLEFNGLQFTQTAEESKALNQDTRPAIILSASGMCDVGRIKHHLKHNLWNPKSTILFVGYQAPGTLGRSIVEGAKKVKIFGEEIAVNARVEYIEGYSGHADQTWLLNFIYSFTNPPKHVFLVHGEPEGQLELKEKIEQTSECKVIIPNFGDSFELEETPKLLEQTKEIELYRKEFRRVDLLDRIEALKENIADIENVIMKQYLDTNDNDLRNLEERVKDIQKQIQSLMK
ncbi:MAG TPA: MBL fold metallo-hydrolase [Candidatus Scatovivens faecipullorum]|mgnify:CR=1 FL=1|nr:MBL fold metallo-hydrolase [Candidatus Scatovivens faecipullorum]